MILGNSISVVFTEYQLIQAESICQKYNFKKSDLIVANTDRINQKLINKSLFNGIYFLPTIYPNGSIKKLGFSYIKKYQRILNLKLKNDIWYDIMIGASDENTGLAIIKNHLKANQYWSIEDGIGNYRKFGFAHDLKINFKKLLFNVLYNKNVEILAQKGSVQKSKSFRIDPELSVNNGEHINLAPSIKTYLSGNIDFYKSLINTEREYETVVVVDKEVKNKNILKNHSSGTLVKKHPKHLNGGDKFTVQNIPIEVLPTIFKNVEKIIYDSYFCSSILNVLSMYDDLEIHLSFDINKRYKNKSMLNFIGKVISKYRHRISLAYEHE